MAKKQESIPEQVVRLYREGYDLDRIASIMQMNKGSARSVLEKHMPDYETYTQPPAPAEDPTTEKGIISKISNPFKKKRKNEDTSAAQTSTINLAYDENGFVDKHTESIAKMIRRGDSDKRIAEFFNCSPSDVKSVKAVLDQQTAEAKSAPKAEPAAAAAVEEEVFNPFLNEKPKREETVSTEATAAEQTYTDYSGGYDPYGPNAVADPYAVPYDPNASDNVSTDYSTDFTSDYSTDTSADEFDISAYIDPQQDPNAEYVPDIKFEDDGLGSEEMPSISTDNLVFAEPPAAPSTDAIDAIAEDEIKFDMDAIDSTGTEEISLELKESDAEMTPMEKMKMFAKQQIDENNAKLQTLNAEKDSAASALASEEAELAETKAKIDDCESQISQLNIQLSDINAKLTDLRSKLSEYQISETKLLDSTVKNRAAAQDLEASIAEILKENEDYESYLK